jgi:hypothetical protein
MNDNEPRAGQEAIINHVRAFGQQVAQETLRKISDEALHLPRFNKLFNAPKINLERFNKKRAQIQRGIAVVKFLSSHKKALPRNQQN